MGYDSGSSKNSVSSYTPSFSSKDSVSSYSSKDSIRLNTKTSSKDSVYTPVRRDTNAPIVSKTTKRLTAAKSIKDILEMIEKLEGLLEKKATIDAEIGVLGERINEALGEVKGDPTFERIKEYILKK